MFYSETLLSKTGPLARVWLSANLERKLSKTHILQSDIETSVGAIVGQDQAPMALRLSGQLLLGVVRIYSRKARYLLEDCNEALMKIKMAFRPGNVDLPSGATAHTAAQLTLPDVITELDLLLPDPSSLLADLGDLNLDGEPGLSRRRDLMIDDSSSFIQSSMEVGRGNRDVDMSYDTGDDILQLEDDLELDIGEPSSFFEEKRATRSTMRERDAPEEHELSIEMGRDRPPSRGMSEELYSRDNFDLDLDVEMGGTTPKAKPRDQNETTLQIEDDLNLLGDDEEIGGADAEVDINAGIGEEISEIQPGDITVTSLGLDQLEGLRSPHQDEAPKDEDDMSPLSSVRSSVERELEAEHQANLQSKGPAEDQSRAQTEDPEEAAAAEAARRVRNERKRKVVVDSVIEIRTKQIKSQQEDRSKILKDPSFLPRDPGVLALVTLQRTGGFATSVFYPKNIHPDLAGMLSPEFVKRMAALKRKREEDVRQEEERDDAEKEGTPAKRIQLELGDDSMLEELAAGDAALLGGKSIDHHDEDDNGDEGEMLDFPRGEDLMQLGGEQTLGDETLAPQVPEDVEDQLPVEEDMLPEDINDYIPPPAETGPLSQQTIRAVHLLRAEFAPTSAASSAINGTPTSTPRQAPGRQTRKLSDLIPPEATNRVDATKMFFEVLVLATKDAVRVKQDAGFAAEIMIMPKKGLWGKWAEERDEQQVAEEEEGRREQEEREKMVAAAAARKEKGLVVDMTIGGGRRREDTVETEGTAAA